MSLNSSRRWRTARRSTSAEQSQAVLLLAGDSQGSGPLARIAAVLNGSERLPERSLSWSRLCGRGAWLFSSVSYSR